MARYNREFLVPYLNNLCTLELARVRTYELLRQANDEIEQLNRAVDSIRIRPRDEEPPLKVTVRPERTEEEAGECAKWAALLAVGCVVAYLVEGSELSDDYSVALGAAFVCVACFVGAIVNLVRMVGLKSRLNDEVRKAGEQKKAHREAVAAQNREYNAYVSKATAEKGQAIAARDRRLPALTRDVRLYRTKAGELDELIDRAYAANVVPIHYRNVYATWYLAEYFSTSRADDVDLVLQTFVLTEIQNQLDGIIEQQQKIIFNQQLAYAEQVASRMGQERFRDQMLERLDGIEASGEERDRYLSMINSNVRATFWMSVANYLKR